MKVEQVTIEDGKMCAQLINLLKNGRWDLSGSDAEALVETKKWLQGVAAQLAQQLKAPQQAAPKIVRMGTIDKKQTKKRKRS